MGRYGARKQQLIKLLIKGKSLKEAANEMGIAHSTAKGYIVAAKRMANCVSTEQLMYILGKEAR